MSSPVDVTFPLWAWLAFFGLVLVLLFLDLFVFHRGARTVSFRESLWLTAFWISISLAFGVFIWFLGGAAPAGEYLTAYLIELSLSVDNVFVFSVIFTSFAVPEQYRYHVLFYGVLGAIVFRGIFVAAGASLLSAFSWLVFVFGAFLLFTGLRMFRGRSQQVDPQNSRVLRFLQRRLPVTEDYRGDNFFVRNGGDLCATPLLAVLVVVETTDLIFAVDSVPAVLSVTQTTFVAYSAVVFAVLGLRALYFALEGLVDRFVYLNYGLAAILVFLGAEFVLQGFGVRVPILVSLLVIATVITIAIVASLIATRGGGKPDESEEGENERNSRSRGAKSKATTRNGRSDAGA